MKKFYLFFLFLLLYNLSFTQECIIDTVYEDQLLGGYIFFSENDQELIVNFISPGRPVGDVGTGGINYDPNSRYRSYISFYLPEIPEGYEVDSSFVRLYQYFSVGNGGSYDFPVWDVPGGDTLFCILDHIDYGYSLDSSDWTKGDPGDPGTLHTNIGIISDSGEDGYRFMDITDYVINDYVNIRYKTQYRIRFPIETDWDYLGDNIRFSASIQMPEYNPMVVIYYKEINSFNNNTIKNELKVENYPNPIYRMSSIVKNQCIKIKYFLPYNGTVLLKIFNMKGQKIGTLVNEYQYSGNQVAEWNTEKQTPGVYFYRIKTGTQTATGKCLLLK